MSSAPAPPRLRGRSSCRFHRDFTTKDTKDVSVSRHPLRALRELRGSPARHARRRRDDHPSPVSALRFPPSVFLFLCLSSPLALRADTHYVNVNSATPQTPYTNWETAATVIQDAVDASVAGDTVLVTNGVYDTGGRVVYGAMSNRVAITNALILQSVNGPEATIIKGQGPRGNSAVRCVYVKTNALVDGFTLTNGFTRASGNQYEEQSGGGTYAAGGTLTAC